MTPIERMTGCLAAAILFVTPVAEARDPTHCESAVTQHCVDETCPAFCDVTTPAGAGHAAALAECVKACTPEGWCLEVPLAGHGPPGHEELDDESRHELIACIAEEYDADGSATGRDTSVPWQKSMAASFADRVKPATSPAPAAPEPEGPSDGCNISGGRPVQPRSLALLGAASVVAMLARRRREP
jgi:hypothetical protein